MSGQDTDIQWFIARDGKQHGPVSDAELKKLVELSHLKATDLIWRQGFTDWRTASSVYPVLSDAQQPPSAASPAQAPAPTVAPEPKAAQPAATASYSHSPASAQQPNAAAPVSQPAQMQPQIQPSSFGAFAPAGSSTTAAKPAPENWLPAGEVRPMENATRPLGTPFPQAGQGYVPSQMGSPKADQRSGGPSMEIPRRAYEEPPKRGRKAVLVATGFLAMMGGGAWIASHYSDEMFSYVQMDDDGAGGPPTVKADMLPPRTAPSPAEAETTPKAVAVETALQTNEPAGGAGSSVADVDRKLQGRTMWVSIKQEFPEWYQVRVAEIARLSAEQKDTSEINRYVVGELVSLRRENARHALAASTPRHKEVASAFLANLKQLSQESGDGCYDFISKGESSQTIVTRIDDPAKSTEIEAQMVAIVGAIAEGKKQPAEHPPPVKTDYDVLAGELGRLGWTQADMQLFANPKELAKAPRSRVCSMLQDWFTAHLAIQDPSTQERLLFETLKPVISG